MSIDRGAAPWQVLGAPWRTDRHAPALGETAWWQGVSLRGFSEADSKTLKSLRVQEIHPDWSHEALGGVEGRKQVGMLVQGAGLTSVKGETAGRVESGVSQAVRWPRARGEPRVEQEQLALTALPHSVISRERPRRVWPLRTRWPPTGGSWSALLP